jgi:hypothetical protein
MFIDLDDYDDHSERNHRIKMYNRTGWDDAQNDVDPSIRMKYYNKFGYTKESLVDDHHAIRYNGYENLGWSKKALEDPALYIKDYALYNKNIW